MQVKTTMAYHFLPSRITIMKRADNKYCGDVEKLEPSYTAGGKVVQLLWKSLIVPHKV